jgi:subtilase family serine protease
MRNELSQVVAGLALLLLTAASGRAAERVTLHTHVPTSAARLARLDRLPATNRLQLAISLPLRNQTALANLLQQLYSPASPNFHRYLTPEQFAAQFGPTEQEYQAVINFATSNRMEVTGKFGNRAVLDVSGNVSDIEMAFHVTLGTYQHPTEDRLFYAPDVEPWVDGALPILSVSGLDSYFIPHPNSLKLYPESGRPTPNLNNGSGTNGSYAGPDFRNAYVPGVSLTGSGQVAGLVEFDGYAASDITKYATLTGVANVPLQPVTLDGVTNKPWSTNFLANAEVSVDIELVMSMAPGLSKINVYEGLYEESVMNEIVSPTNGETLPSQVSSSWGLDTGIDSQLMEMASQGQSFFYASGDTGAPAGGINASPTPDNYLTSVGGTALSMNGVGASWLSETAWSGSYGAVDTTLPIPDFQTGINMSLNRGSTTHRNVPDVAMEADFVMFVTTAVFTNGNPPMHGVVGTGAGTSAAAPLWAAYTALANQQAAAQGKPTVGFINRALTWIGNGPSYANCFHDITVGSNTNTNSPNAYYATYGYDLCTGWGSPNGINLINALIAFDSVVWVDFNYTGGLKLGTYDYPFSTLAQGTNAVPVGGNIAIKTAGSSLETMTISKPMTIGAFGGPATVGH